MCCARARPDSTSMRGDDGHREQVWNKRGSRLQLPRVPRPSLKTSLKALPGIGIVSLTLVGFLAVPAGSPPPPPAVAAEPIATVETTPTPVEIVDTPPAPPAPEPVIPVCRPKGIGSGHLPPPSDGQNAITVVHTNSRSSVNLYDVKTRTSRILVRATAECGYFAPRFVDSRTVAFIVQSRIAVVDTVTGATHLIQTNLKKDDPVWGFSASRAGGRVASLGGWGGNPLVLTISSLDTGVKIFSRRLGYLCACDGTPTPLEVSWSPDGTLLLVGVTETDDSGSIYMFDRSGHQVRGRIKGGTARWIGQRSFIIETVSSNAVRTWVKIDTAGHRQTLFTTASILSMPRLSPDGTKIAFSDSDGYAARFQVYDLSTKTLRGYGHLRSWPLWLSNNTVAVSRFAPCNCEGVPFQMTGVVDAVDLTSGSVSRIGLHETVDADALF